MKKLQLIFIITLITFNVACKDENQDSEVSYDQKEEVNIAISKEAIKDTIRKMINTYEYKDLASIFGGKITVDLSTSKVDADDIWKFADENPDRFLKWYNKEIKPRNQKLREKYNGKVYIVGVLFVELPEKSSNGVYLNWQTKIFTSDPIEHRNFTEEKEYRLLDEMEKEIKTLKYPRWPLKVVNRYSRTFYSYPEASDIVYDARN